MYVTIKPTRLKGCVSAPPSKSMAHRYLICAGLAEGESLIRGVSDSMDMQATLNLLKGLGTSLQKTGNTVSLWGCEPHLAAPNTPLDCLECGSTLRFFIPICLLSGKEMTLCGSPRLFARPLDVFEALCRERGLGWRQTESRLTLKGPLQGGEFTLPGNVSSQFISGLLFALPLCREDSVIRILPPLESRSYVDMTLSALRSFGIRVQQVDDLTYAIPGGQSYLCQSLRVEGDYSNAAFLDALAALGHDVTVTGLDPHSLQGDQIYKSHFEELFVGTPTLSLAQCPDLGPILMALAAAGKGAVFTHTRRLAIKESDRGAAMAEELAKLGARVERKENSITVYPGIHAPTVPLDGHNDHRIVMSLAVLLTLTGGELRGAEAVNKSFPDFFETMKKLGAEIEIHETASR